jgi:hypothetical protein
MNATGQALTELTHIHLGLFTGGILGGTNSSSPQQVAPTPIIQRPWVNPPEGFVPYDNAAAIALPAVAATGIVVSFQVPDGFDGVINQFSWNFTGGGFVQGSGDIIVQVTRNTAPVRNFENIQVEKGTIGIPRPISPIRVYSGQTISIVVNHAANALLNGFVVGSLVGYFYPSQN